MLALRKKRKHYHADLLGRERVRGSLGTRNEGAAKKLIFRLEAALLSRTRLAAVGRPKDHPTRRDLRKICRVCRSEGKNQTDLGTNAIRV